MKLNKSILSAALAAAVLSSCSDRPDDLLFQDFFVYVQDENGAATSRVVSSSDNFVVTYYFNLVSETIKEPLTVNFELTVGDGLKKGVDFALQSESTSVTFEPGIYRKPFRINYKNNPVDPSKDNTITIRITSASDPSITLGYPGPSHKFISHTIEKYNL